MPLSRFVAFDIFPRNRYADLQGVSAHEGDPELVEVVWRRFGQHVILTYAGSHGRDHKFGDLGYATAVAEEAGLELIESSSTVVHWVKDPKSWSP